MQRVSASIDCFMIVSNNTRRASHVSKSRYTSWDTLWRIDPSNGSKSIVHTMLERYITISVGWAIDSSPSFISIHASQHVSVSVVHFRIMSNLHVETRIYVLRILNQLKYRYITFNSEWTIDSNPSLKLISLLVIYFSHLNISF